jgi:hypothetical protein
MFKRFSANYSLWPERARPRRGIPRTPAAGGFVVGFVCAIAAYNVISDFVAPATVQKPGAQSVVANRGSRTRAPVAKVTLPIIGSQAAVPGAATDDAPHVRPVAAASVAGLAASSGNPPSLIREEGESARQPPAQEAGADEAKPAARKWKSRSIN